MIVDNQIEAYNIPSGILFDMHRDAAAQRPGVLTKVGIGTFVDPDLQGCAMNDARPPSTRSCARNASTARSGCTSRPSCRNVAIIRATTADERGNLTYEHEGALLGGLDQALAARNNGGIVIAQVKRVVKEGSLRPHDVHVPVQPGGLHRGRSRPEADHADGLRPGDQRRDPAAARDLRARRPGARRRSSRAARRWSWRTAQP